MPEIIVFVIGVAAALRGADWIGKSAVSWAKRYNLSQVAIGATVVSLATTLPELSFAIFSGALNNEPRLGLGAVLGSPLANLGLILGLFFLFSKSRPQLGYYSRTLYVFLLLAVLLLVISTNSKFGGLISFLLIVLGFAFLLLEFLIGRRNKTPIESIFARFEEIASLFDFTKERKEIFEFLVGTILLAFGSKFAVDSVFSLATALKVNELFLSLTLVAFGTSLPELFTAFNSLLNKRVNISIGNLVGASIIDLTVGVGIGTFFHPTTLTSSTSYIIFTPMILVGIFGLLAVWKKIPLKLVGTILISISLFFLLILTFNGAS